MIKKRRWLWVFLFVAVSLLISVLATGWNVVLVKDYQKFLELARTFSLPNELTVPQTHLIVNMIVGTVGFLTVLTLTILIFIKLLSEMKLNQQQSEFLAAVSHELKTPIASMELSSSLLKAGGLTSKEEKDLWNSHNAELKRLREEVETLLEAARWQVRPITAVREPIWVEEWIQKSWEHWKTLLGPQATFKREGPPLDLEIKADVKNLNLIFDNLLSNARKYSRGFPNVTLKTSKLEAKKGFSKPRWQIQVEDHGWGFDPDLSNKLFNRFYRAKSLAPYSIPGTGLGLYLAHSASRAMGFRLKANSKGMGLGAVFTLEGSIKYGRSYF